MTTPAGHPVNKMQRRRNKVKDKPPPEPHREYLDAESSDEAEGHGKIYEKNIKRAPTSSSPISAPPIFRFFPCAPAVFRAVLLVRSPLYFRHLRARTVSTSVLYDSARRTVSLSPNIPPLNLRVYRGIDHDTSSIRERNV